MEEEAEIQRYLDQDNKRHYTKDQLDVYSVTTILDNLETNQYGIQKWKQKNNGLGDNADWTEILDYKTNRGTLAHYAVLNQFEDKHPHDTRLWSEDEKASLNQLMDKTGDSDYFYSVLNSRDWIKTRDAFENYQERMDTELTDVLYKDLDYVKNTFNTIFEEKGITQDHIITVEHMFALPENDNPEHKGFGGQADLIYEDPETGEHVVADLKTSKNIYDKHKYQAAAYAQAAMESPEMNGDYIDRAEIIRICPDTEDYEVYELEDHKQYWSEFAELTAH